MSRAVIHIGTEKTGTTSLQSFLVDNLDALRDQRFLYPSSCGFASNMRLVVCAKRNPEADLLSPGIDISTPAARQQWENSFRTEHTNQVEQFLSHAADDGTVIYSSEHLQSRLCETPEIENVRDILQPLYDNMTILIYLRRQDRYALSAHSSSLRGGAIKPFSFSGLHKEGPYYNYRRTLEQWASVFGSENIVVRLFEPEFLYQGDVISDFMLCTGLSTALTGKGIDPASLHRPTVENSALSFTARQQMLLFNQYVASGELSNEVDEQALRQYFIKSIESVTDNLGNVKPARREAQEFYDFFRDDNQFIADTWLGGESFAEDFSEYPENGELPRIQDQSAAVQTLIDSFVTLKAA